MLPSHQMLDEEQAALMRRCVIAAAPKTLSADQLAGLELVCSGRDGLILLRTGGGKTLLWQLPALQGGGLTVVVVLSVALALDLKQSTDEIIAGTGLSCCYDERSENGEAVASAEVPPAASAPSAAEAAFARIARAALAPRLWRCETECIGCAPPPGKPCGKCYYKCGTCPNCIDDDASAAAEAVEAAAEGCGGGGGRRGGGDGRGRLAFEQKAVGGSQQPIAGLVCSGLSPCAGADRRRVAATAGTRAAVVWPAHRHRPRRRGQVLRRGECGELGGAGMRAAERAKSFVQMTKNPRNRFNRVERIDRRPVGRARRGRAACPPPRPARSRVGRTGVNFCAAGLFRTLGSTLHIEAREGKTARKKYSVRRRGLVSRLARDRPRVQLRTARAQRSCRTWPAHRM